MNFNDTCRNILKGLPRESLVKEDDGKSHRNELQNLIDGDYENLVGMSAQAFYDWAAGMIPGLTRETSDEVHEVYLG